MAQKEKKWMITWVTRQGVASSQSGTLIDIIGIISDPDLDIAYHRITYGVSVDSSDILQMAVEHGLLDLHEDEEAIEAIKQLEDVEEARIRPGEPETDQMEDAEELVLPEREGWDLMVMAIEPSEADEHLIVAPPTD